MQRPVFLPWQGLLELKLGNKFNQSLQQITSWPGGLQSLSLGDQFNQTLEKVAWPSGLQSLIFGYFFNQTLASVALPRSLQCLVFGCLFNQSLEEVVLPSSLEALTLGDCFHQKLDGVTWPQSLQSLTFGANSVQRVQRDVLPMSLKCLVCGGFRLSTMMLQRVVCFPCACACAVGGARQPGVPVHPAGDGDPGFPGGSLNHDMVRGGFPPPVWSLEFEAIFPSTSTMISESGLAVD